MSTANAVILGCLGPRLSAAEKTFFQDAEPWGFILFARNIENPEQLRELICDLRTSVGRNAPVLLDQEGGRVQRLRAPYWREWTPALDFAVATQGSERAMFLRYQLIAAEMHALGFDVNCAPMLDVATAASHAIIRNRCYGNDPASVAKLGRAVADGLLAGGVLPILKHIPGHGRTPLDSHKDLPVVDTPLTELQATDFAPFRALNDLPMAMTAHIVYPAIDAAKCATLSGPVIDCIRQDIGFDGLLMSDDLSMHALGGNFADRAGGAIAAGCDMLLHCNGERTEMEPVLAETPALSGKALQRAEAALAQRGTPEDFDPLAALAEIESLSHG